MPPALPQEAADFPPGIEQRGFILEPGQVEAQFHRAGTGNHALGFLIPNMLGDFRAAQTEPEMPRPRVHVHVPRCFRIRAAQVQIGHHRQQCIGRTDQNRGRPEHVLGNHIALSWCKMGRPPGIRRKENPEEQAHIVPGKGFRQFPAQPDLQPWAGRFCLHLRRLPPKFRQRHFREAGRVIKILQITRLLPHGKRGVRRGSGRYNNGQ
ncbi:MAG: hypothetical protein BWY09_02155 [Candidatus Hydrogenedentes bacterium ADurb.Bin179]|nr:MAG: hypothetical protein BWY09_02155 [Candidatus Hydrogenedentes bacterium ADurb.Bin179]